MGSVMESILLATLFAFAVGIFAGYYFGHKKGQVKGFTLAPEIQVGLLGVFSENYTGGHNKENDISHMVYDIQWVKFHSLIPIPINPDLVIIKADDFALLVKKAIAADRS
jgi:hypothetical protein